MRKYELCFEAMSWLKPNGLTHALTGVWHSHDGHHRQFKRLK
jgi:hypothetical protein